MTIQLRHELETVSFVFLASVVATFFVFYTHQTRKFVPITPIQIPNFVASEIGIPSPTPTPPLVPQPTYASQLSSDGTKEITMKTLANEDLTKTYTFTITDMGTNTENLLFTQEASASSTMSIPFNAFSPDDKLVFLKDIEAGRAHYLVFNVSLDTFANGEKYLDVTDAFHNYTSSYRIDDVTGWAAETLLIVNAESSSGKGPSFWYDVPSGEFIPLATYFP